MGRMVVRMLHKSGVTKPFEVTTKHKELIYKFWTGFCTGGHGGNLIARVVLLKYAKLQTEGIFVVHKEQMMNEAHAMARAIIAELTTLRKSLSGVEPGLWLLPVILAMNEHMMYFSRIPPINISAIKSEDKAY